MSLDLSKDSYLYKAVTEFIENNASVIATGDFDLIFNVGYNENVPYLLPALYTFMTEAGIDIEFTHFIPSKLFKDWEGSPAVFKVPSGVTEIGEESFLGSDIEEIELPNSLTKIGSRCFYDAEKLKSIKLPVGLKFLGRGCFAHTEVLKELNFPPLKKIPEVACNCSNVERVTLSEGTEEIGVRAFRLCDCLVDVKLPKSLKLIAADAFSDCAALESIDYAGTMEDWKAIKRDPNAFSQKEAPKIKCADGEIEYYA